MTTPVELRNLDDNELRDHVAQQKRELFGLRLQHATGELENTAALKRAKREIARALTVARQRGIHIEASARMKKAKDNG